ncbi:hypothetical protein [Sinobaca sp. H24]|uniref:hypothetical protein n=1 Tax=Sinobaca sp. H24 TaxID=2923376 RepID=UPI002079AF44|nr:hypothetical protein [Sinobaca sp. H24]
MSALGITTISYALGSAAAIYYIGILFEPLPAGEIFISVFVYWVWLLFVVTTALVWSTVSKRTSVAAAGALITLLLLNLSASMFGELTSWTPGILPEAAVDIQADIAIAPVIVSFLLAALLIAASVSYMKKTDWLL